MRFPVGFDGSHISPIRLVLVAKDAVVFEHSRDDVAAEVMSARITGVRIGLKLLYEDVFVEDIDAHRGPRTAGVFRLFLEVNDAAVRIEVEHTKAVGILS